MWVCSSCVWLPRSAGLDVGHHPGSMLEDMHSTSQVRCGRCGRRSSVQESVARLQLGTRLHLCSMLVDANSTRRSCVGAMSTGADAKGNNRSAPPAAGRHPGFR